MSWASCVAAADPAGVPCRAVRLLLSLLLVPLLVSCSTSPTPQVAPTASGADREAVLGDLRAEVAAVAEQQADADAEVNAVLRSVRKVDEAVTALEDVVTFDEVLGTYEADVHADVAATEANGLREGYLAVAEDVDGARQTLADARSSLDDPWEMEYLDAQDEVLLAVRAYAQTADRLAQLLEQHWPTYVDVDARVVDFAARRGNYRDTPEAAKALAVELDTVLDDLAIAEAQIAEYRSRRTTAGQEVNDASDAAIAVYQRRPVAPEG